MIVKDIKWIWQISKNLCMGGVRNKTQTSLYLAKVGIAIGVASLIIVMSVMNGFQGISIDSILEISSYHLQCKVPNNTQNFLNAINNCHEIRACVPYMEAQGLVISNNGRQSVVLIRALDSNVRKEDIGFATCVKMQSGDFIIDTDADIVLGSSLAKTLGVRVGSTVNILALSGNKDTQLLSTQRVFNVRGIFHCGYADINRSYAFININTAKHYMGGTDNITYGIKLYDSENIAIIQRQLEQETRLHFSTWHDYNSAFFGALRVEKNTMLILMILIFIVVGINIYNAMNKIIFERKSEIAILNALGARNYQIISVFVLKGVIDGFIGSVSGLVIGLFISCNMNIVFSLTSNIMYWGEYILFSLVSPDRLVTLGESAAFMLYSQIPARIYEKEVFATVLFGIISTLFSCIFSSKKILKFSIIDILHAQ